MSLGYHYVYEIWTFRKSSQAFQSRDDPPTVVV